MPINKVYAKPGQDAIPTYNYTDIANGTGVVVFQGFSCYASGGVTHHLTANSIASDYIESGASATTGWNFNLTPFNKPQLARGTALVRFSAQIQAGEGYTLHWEIFIQKVNLDASVTTLGSVVTIPFASAAGAALKNFTNKIALTTTKFKRGETLRVRVISYPTTRTHYFGHDPTNRDGVFVTPAATYPTKFEVHIPFKVDIN